YIVIARSGYCDSLGSFEPWDLLGVVNIAIPKEDIVILLKERVWFAIFPPLHAYSPYAAGPPGNGCLVHCFPIPPRISYSPITLIARNRHYAPSAPITHSVSFPFFSFVFCPRPQRSDSPTLPCTGNFFSLPLTLSSIIVHQFCPLTLLHVDLQGWGVRAGEPILSGTFVCEYVGEILGEQKANNRLTRFQSHLQRSALCLYALC
ncbi:hypothetical protein Gotur_000942, partial [Gossypium turneri]